MTLEAITDLGEVQARLMYSVIVAGKSAKFANTVMARWFAANAADEEMPFAVLKRLKDSGKLEASFREARTGNYGKLTAAMSQVVDMDIDLLTCTPQQLEEIPGIGPKTSRFFIMWIRPEERYAALDVHILRWMKKFGYDVPKSTPQSSKKYAQIEQWFIAEADHMGMTPRELDAIIWDEGSTAANKTGRNE
jgi:endonuclease III